MDLYPIVRQAVRAGVESYSIKQLEQYFGYPRRVELRTVREPLLAVELALESNAPEAIAPAIRDAVQGYNEDDCRSTEALRDWLESIRDEWMADGADVPRPEPEKSADPTEKVAALQQDVAALRGAAAGGAAGRSERARTPGASSLAARVPDRLAPARGERRVVGILPAEGTAERGPA